jgi:hypothetical protein
MAIGISNTRGFEISSIDLSNSTTRRVRFEYRIVSLYENQGTEKSSLKAIFRLRKKLPSDFKKNKLYKNTFPNHVS